MSQYKPRHVSQSAVEALDEKIRQMNERKRIEEKRIGKQDQDGKAENAGKE